MPVLHLKTGKREHPNKLLKPPPSPRIEADEKLIAYDKRVLIGRGAFGKVFRARRRRDGMQVALKMIDLRGKTDKVVQQALNEVRVMLSFRAPQAVHQFASFVENGHVCLVMELMEGGDLEGFIKERGKQKSHLSIARVLLWTFQIVSGVNRMHMMRVLHRDLKPQNIFLTRNGDAKIGDLGLSRVMSDKTLVAHTVCGTPLYQAPEVCSGDGYDDKADVWSIGCILYEMMAFRPPFIASNHLALYNKVINDTPKPLPECYPSYLSNIVRRMLSKVASDRPPLTEVREVLLTALEREGVACRGSLEVMEKGFVTMGDILRRGVQPKLQHKIHLAIHQLYCEGDEMEGGEEGMERMEHGRCIGACREGECKDVSTCGIVVCFQRHLEWAKQMHAGKKVAKEEPSLPVFDDKADPSRHDVREKRRGSKESDEDSGSCDSISSLREQLVVTKAQLDKEREKRIRAEKKVEQLEREVRILKIK
ncbi:hypothetical protein ADUPG1_012632 [Aduncisulcus paluster]|uniref:non-specific serine/threonine protein kinase n=1 Tax=Aduncisulcus paluster TaxID=2918883 RepID=A0ABQ5K039_9EUKA|nr:hypothetical protein ADUPG1_012632 [Aduncisulcus paluster]